MNTSSYEAELARAIHDALIDLVKDRVFEEISLANNGAIVKARDRKTIFAIKFYNVDETAQLEPDTGEPA